ncbi:MopE-related protein [Chondromyces apiculatus]|uniref:MopE-related protein n=1 Tax=Chondromyces apiculatus TaxID=51 RepID=UPI0018CC6EC6|nr:MopE-related protein [Chondromyces apiculatus]
MNSQRLRARRGRVRMQALALLGLLLVLFGAVVSCTDILGIDTDYEQNPCNAPSASQLDPIDCHQGACRALVDACDSQGLPAACPDANAQEKDLCNDGFDNDCDGYIDEDECPCEDGLQKQCFTGSPATRNRGMCQDGVQVCMNGVWGECEGAILPVKEVCDQLDNDCDEDIDEGCSCNDGDEQFCYGGPEVTIGEGLCTQGKQQCIDGGWGDCVGDVTPKLEQCDKKDNDCNGEVDLDSEFCECVEDDPCYDDVNFPNTRNIGICRAGVYPCVNGKKQTDTCVGMVTPLPVEACNAQDDNCNGESDEGIQEVGQGCSTGLEGACNPGIWQCSANGLYCQPNYQPDQLPEQCDGEDDDCDGVVDEGQFCCPNDGRTSGNETDVDCGGSCQQKCADGLVCSVNTDCQSSSCQGQICATPTCDDGQENGNESDVDCGGSCPDKCSIGSTCNGNSDCVTNVCDLTTHVCAQKPNGATCQQNDECLNNFCVDGVCCNQQCLGPCRACTAQQKGVGQDGTCGNIVTGTDPDEECAATNPFTCNTTGVCDGFGACQVWPQGTSCSSPICVNDVTAARPDTCISAGQCQDAGTEDCTPYRCNGATGTCRSGCSSDVDCTSSYYCNALSCTAKKPNGQTCGGANECASGSCVDGFCCNTACNTTCQACSASRTGSLPNGTCGPVIANTDPDNECATQATDTCGTTGVCNGSGACSFYPLDTVCSPASCVDLVTLNRADVCNGSGTCNVLGNVNCAPYVCDPSGGSAVCRVNCSSDLQCASDHYCSGTSCAPKKPIGSQCTGLNECGSGHCVDGYCCNTDCAGTCYACSLAKTGLANGLCEEVTVGTDPDNECASQPVTTCGQDGTCNGAGACRLHVAGTECVPAACQGDTAVANADTCNGLGSCVDNGVTSCGQYLCSGGVCTDMRPDGASCTLSSQCGSGQCVDGVCCGTACTGVCMACTAAKKGSGVDGVCGAITAGMDPDDDCSAQSATTCGRDGTCDGTGACRMHVAGTSCSSPSCASGTSVNAVDTCNGQGTCVDSGTTSCAPFTCASGACTSLKINGTLCGASGECASGACVDGVCCDGACTGPCQACSAFKKGGGADGTCGPVANGIDPDNECAQEAPSTCGQDGMCSGSGSCRRYAAGVICEAATCANETTVAAADTCDGNGVCTDGGTSSCGQFICSGSTCTQLKINGAACGAAGECASNSCVDGVCCASACGGACQACTAAKKGGGADGTCGPIAVGTDPDNDCAAESAASCGRDGMCNGAGACRLHASGTVCAAATCENTTTVDNPHTCDGGGTCVDGGTTSCGQFTCAGGACTTEKILGVSCANSGECASNFCVDGVCCESACPGLCQACSMAKKGGGANGICGPIATGSDPDSECTTDPVATCDQDGSCNGAGACRLYASGTACSTATCADATTVNAVDTCNGSGTCVESGTASCGEFLCSGGACSSLKIDGALCAQGSECDSGFCVDGVCCETSCGGLCEACSMTKKGTGPSGTCGPVAAGNDPDSECVADDVASCGQDGTCGGGGACRLYPMGTTCAPASCVNETTVDGADACNGSGVCVSVGTTDCGVFACDGGACTNEKVIGEPCTTGNECASGFCADGVCCDTACDASCDSCSADRKELGEDGECGPSAVGLECAPASCSPDGASANLTDRCDGSGVCVDAGTESCQHFACVSGACEAACVDDTSCAPGAYCGDSSACYQDVVLMLGGGGTLVGASFHPGGSWSEQQITGAETTERVALTVDTVRGVGLVRHTGAVGTDELRFTTWSSVTKNWTAWSQVNTDYPTNAKPAITSLNGTAHTAFLHDTGTDIFRYAAYDGGWSTHQSISMFPSLPLAGDIAVLASGGGTPAFVYINGTALRFTQRSNNDWPGGFTSLDTMAAPNVPPSIVSMTGTVYDLLTVYVHQTDGRICFRSRNSSTSNWTATDFISSSTTVTTADQVALAALPGGSAVIAFRSNAAGTAGRLFTSFYRESTNAWSVPAEMSNTFTIVGAPAVARGTGAGTPSASFVELGFVKDDTTDTLHHIRCTAMPAHTCTAWSNPVQVSSTPVTSVAIASAP